MKQQLQLVPVIDGFPTPMITHKPLLIKENENQELIKNYKTDSYHMASPKLMGILSSARGDPQMASHWGTMGAMVPPSAARPNHQVLADLLDLLGWSMMVGL